MNKGDEVLKELGEIAKALNIKIAYVINDEIESEYLVCNETKIYTYLKSIQSIRQEFFGYVFLNEWRNRSLGASDKQVRDVIRSYWYKEIKYEGMNSAAYRCPDGSFDYRDFVVYYSYSAKKWIISPKDHTLFDCEIDIWHDSLKDAFLTIDAFYSELDSERGC